ncbi:MAG: hypothetical protein AAF230_01025 [Pseudomonadota bacterium]
MRTLLAAAFLAVAAPAVADTANGTVSTYDKQLNLLILDDKTIWQLGDDTIVPPSLATGDRIVIDFTSAGDDGVASVESVIGQVSQDA